MRRLAASLGAVALVLASCSTTTDQPGLDHDPAPGPSITSNTLGVCPAGGPDENTPPAGCLGPDGSVLRP